MTTGTPLRVGLVCDLLEENWPSMDLIADELLRALPAVASPRITPTRIRPTMPQWPAVLARMTHTRAATNANRYADRHRRYPRWLSSHRGSQDTYHVVDHTYAHLVHELPAARTVVTCHDVDAFRSLFDPAAEPRGPMFRQMTERVLGGLRRAAVVACDSVATRDALVEHGLRTARLEVVPLGVHPAFRPSASGYPAADADAPILLHVGSTIVRKRLDVLLQVFSRVRRQVPGARLVRIGGPFTDAQHALARKLGVDGAIAVMPRLERDALAGEYRKAALVLLPSDAEGFGLPVAEAMACGTPVVASNLPVLREVGGAATTYAPVADADQWATVVGALLVERATAPGRWAERRRAAVAQAAGFTWERCAQRMAELYAEVADG
ncbi:MAG: glycosyltransferase family 4 protein [Gemmatimonadaceae bacterium]